MELTAKEISELNRWFNRKQFCKFKILQDDSIDIYFEGACSEENRIKIYCYVACCGLLWSNWCEYKRNLGVEFGEYSLLQYRYAKEYYKKAKKRMENLKGNENE